MTSNHEFTQAQIVIGICIVLKIDPEELVLAITNPEEQLKYTVKMSGAISRLIMANQLKHRDMDGFESTMNDQKKLEALVEIIEKSKKQ